MKIGIIVGSTRQGRVGAPVSKFVEEALAEQKRETILLDLADYTMPFVDSATIPAMLGEKYEHEAVTKWSEAVKSVDALIFVTPEYNHGYPAVLKNAIDWLWTEWKDKPAAIVSYSGAPFGGVRGVEQLKLVLNRVGLRITQNHLAIGSARGSVPEESKDYVAKSLIGIVDELKALQQA